jgi:hypothetical protein
MQLLKETLEFAAIVAVGSLFLSFIGIAIVYTFL